MEATFFKYIIKHSWRQQAALLAITILSFPFLYYSLELPKLIINKAIGSSDFPRNILGYEFAQIEFLAALCLVFLLLVGVNGAFKYIINVYKGRLGERMLRRLRYQLFGNALRFPLHRFRRVSQGELVAMITSEVEPLGGFIGDAIALPAFQGGTLLTILVFMFIQDPVLGTAAIALYPVQMYVIPKLQRQVNALAKERVRTVRRLSERIGETVTVIEEIRVHDTAELHRAEFAALLGKIYDIRFKIYKKKFLIKFLNNFIAQLTPFFFFSIGGYLVIQGDLTFGALVAVLAAYKDLSSPWKELLDWYQIREDTRIKYDQLREQFEYPDMLPEEQLTPAEGTSDPLAGRIEALNLSVEEEGGVKLLDGASFRFDLGERVGFAGGSSSGASTAARVLARLTAPSAGTVRIGENELAQLSAAVIGRRMAYVGPNAALIQGTLRDNLLYGLKHRPLTPVAPGTGYDPVEAERTGNTTSHPAADWIDYEAAGAADTTALVQRAIEALKWVDLEEDTFDFGLKGTISTRDHAALAHLILEARKVLRHRLEEPRFKDLVEPFERDKLNRNMSVAENILFGRPVGEVFGLDRIGDNPYMRQILDQVGLTDDFRRMGYQVATIMVDLFEGLPPGHALFERFSFIDSTTLPELKALLPGVEAAGIEAAEPADVARLMALPFQLIPARHRLGIGLLSEQMERHLLDARHAFAANLPAQYRSAIAFFQDDAFNTAATIQDNILFGKLVYGRQQSQREIGALLAEVIGALELRRPIIEVGLDFEVGISGGRLSASQRQRLALARALIKRPDILILDRATATLDHRSQATVQAALSGDPARCGVVWVVDDADSAGTLNRIIRFESGSVIEDKPLTDGPPMPAVEPAADQTVAPMSR
ncbi:Multidrug transporter [uncultured Defluviicoccus sp.]|uniref:Multidrug transporter n=1 Tax=metagenome TaxID=256318 RepID=A0A380TA00_9ZZZZ|nr:Multidrug transporter [uncultured Defluviicoccus sp.]